MAIESIYADAFLDSRLSSDATLIGVTALGAATQVFRERAKQGAVPPYLIYNLQAGVDYTNANKGRLFVEYLYQVRIVGLVKGVDLQDASKVIVASNAMDASLNNVRRVVFAVGAVSYSFNVWRESELAPREEDGETADVKYRNYGGLYRVQVF